MPRLSAAQTHRVHLTLNGRPVEGDAEPRMLLSDFLRHVLGFTGTHIGCEHGVCGACTIEIDGTPARACLMLAVQADGSTHGRSRHSRAGSPFCKKRSGGIMRSSAASARRAS